MNIQALFSFALLVLFALTETAKATYVGGDPMPLPGRSCTTCGSGTQKVPTTSSNGIGTLGFINANTGSLSQSIPVSDVGSAAMDLALTYHSENANGDRVILDSGLGYGWTHTYNIFLFSQGTSFFRIDGTGNVTRFVFGGGGGPGSSSSAKYVATTGYFEMLQRNPDGSYTLTHLRDGITQRFASVTGTFFALGGPVYRLMSITDRNGLTTTITYNAGNLTGITDPFGRSLSLGYDVGHHLTTVTDALGRQTKLGYDSTAANRKLISVQDPDTKTEHYTYDFTNNLSLLKDKDGRRFTYSYANGKALKAVDQNDQVLFSMTNPANWATNSATLATTQMRTYQVNPSTGTMTTSKADGRGNVWIYEYDANGMARSATAPDGAKTRYVYDPPTLRLASQTDANGHVTTYQYDSIGNVVRETDTLGHQTLLAYANATCPDKVTRTTLPNGSITDFAYDAHCNLTSENRDTGGLHLISAWTYDTQGHVLTATDPNGHVTTYEYNAFGDQTKVTDAEGHVTRYQYNAVGLRTQTIDANNHTTAYTYDGLNRLLTETNPLGYVTAYAYDGQGNRTQISKLVSQQPPKYEITQYQYDSRSRLIQETRDPAGLNLVTHFTYDGNNNRVTMLDPRGKTTQYAYDLQNRLNKLTDALGNVTQTQFDPVGNRTCAIDANGHDTFYEYDVLNRQTRETRKIGAQSCTVANSNDILTQTFYDSGAAISSSVCKNAECAGPVPGSSSPAYRIDPKGKYAYFKYDKLNRRVMSIRKVDDAADDCDADDWCAITQYDAVDNVLARYDANGNPSTYTYFLNNWLKTNANALAETTTYTYDGVGKIKTVHTPGGNTLTNTYNARNELVQVDDVVGRVANYAYDGIGNRQAERDGNGNGSSYSFDAVNRPTAVTDAMGQTTNMQYDPDGNLIKTTDRDNHVVCYVYDAINRQIRQVRKVGSTDCTVNGGDGGPNDVWNKTGYDAVGNIIERTTAKNNGGGTPTACNVNSPMPDCQTTRYVYDEVNRLVQEVYPLRFVGDTVKNTREFGYDNAGNVVQRVDQNAQLTCYTYNDLYYLTRRSYPVFGCEFETGRVFYPNRFTYDVGGRMTEAVYTDVDFETFIYDAANRVLLTAQNGQAVIYDYDTANRKRSVNYPGGKSVVEQRDFRERLGTLNAGAIATYEYDAGNRVTIRAYGNGTQAAYSYDPNDWITGINHTKNDSSLVAGFGYAYDNEGNKQYEDKALDPARSEGYQYDDLYRLIHFNVGALDLSGGIPLPLTQSQYDLDKLGNWNSKTTEIDANPPVVENRQHNAVNEITAIDAVSLSYDANGNLLEDAAYRYRYDGENRLIQVQRKSDSSGVNYSYDALSRRVSKDFFGLAIPSPVINYYYDGERLIEERDDSGVTKATYVYGNYIDEVLTMDRGGQTLYNHQNALWSTIAVTDSVGTVWERYAYDAFGLPKITDGIGNLLGTHSNVGNPWLFTGRQFDEESGLYDYRSRHYDPIKGRFIQRDSIGIWGDPANLGNGYAYVGNRPTTSTDPLGTWFVSMLLKAGFSKDLACGVGISAGIAGGVLGFETVGAGFYFAAKEVADAYVNGCMKKAAIVATKPIPVSPMDTKGNRTDMCIPDFMWCPPPTPTDCFFHPWQFGCPWNTSIGSQVKFDAKANSDKTDGYIRRTPEPLTYNASTSRNASALPIERASSANGVGGSTQGPRNLPGGDPWICRWNPMSPECPGHICTIYPSAPICGTLGSQSLF